jgi:hypothetical protein
LLTTDRYQKSCDSSENASPRIIRMNSVSSGACHSSRCFCLSVSDFSFFWNFLIRFCISWYRFPHSPTTNLLQTLCSFFSPLRNILFCYRPFR